MSFDVWIPGADTPAFLEPLADALDEGIHLDVGEAPRTPLAVRVLVRGVPSAEQLDALPSLRHVIIPYAGVPEATRGLLSERPAIRLHNLHHNAASTAELAIGLMLAALKRIVPHDQDLRAGDWRRRYGEPETTTLEGRRALVLGYGAIGRRIAVTCMALGMAVSALRRQAVSGDTDDGISLHSASSLHALLPDADVLLLCLPLTPDTRGLLGAAELALLPGEACVVNVGRGALVDESALFHALRDGAIDSAGLDVWYAYPQDESARQKTPPSAFPFGELSNVVLSPHRAGLTRQNESLRARDVAALVNAVARGEEPSNPVDLKQGY